MTFVKGISGNPAGKPKGTKNRETLLKEERRAIFEKKASEKWEKIIDELPPTYVADQFMGKAPDELKVSGEIKTNLTEEQIAKINEIALDEDEDDK